MISFSRKEYKQLIKFSEMILTKQEDGFRNPLSYHDYINSLFWWTGVNGGESVNPNGRAVN